MLGKLSWLSTLRFAANLETIHKCSSSVYGVLKLEQSHFTHALWLKKEFKTDSSVCGYYVYQKNLMLVIEYSWLVRKREEGVDGVDFQGIFLKLGWKFFNDKNLQLAKIHENCESIPP